MTPATARWLVTLVGVLVAAGCGDNGSPTATPDAGGPDAAPVGQGSQAASDLAINEVAPSGDPDWFEIVNRSDEAVDLCDFFATDGLDRLDHYHPLGGAAPPDPCEPRLLAAGEYLVILADDRIEPGMDHAPFQLADADEVHLGDWSGHSVDSLLYLDIAGSGRSLARAPDREGLFFPAEPSPGEPNPEVAP